MDIAIHVYMIIALTLWAVNMLLFTLEFFDSEPDEGLKTRCARRVKWAVLWPRYVLPAIYAVLKGVVESSESAPRQPEPSTKPRPRGEARGFVPGVGQTSEPDHHTKRAS